MCAGRLEQLAAVLAATGCTVWSARQGGRGMALKLAHYITITVQLSLLMHAGLQRQGRPSSEPSQQGLWCGAGTESCNLALHHHNGLP